MNNSRRILPRFLRLLAAAGLISAPAVPLHAQFLLSPQPGDVYKEFSRTISSTTRDYRVVDPNATHPEAQQFKPNPVFTLTVSDTVGAVRAEVVLDHWGGHPGTTDKRFRFNGRNWITIPEMGVANGIPAGSSGQCYLQQLNHVMPIPLNQLRQGTNTFEGTSGGQTCHNFGFGMWGWYGIIVRVYYGPAKARPSGSILAPAAGTFLSENPVISASASGSAGISRVEFFGSVDAYDVDGDGIFTGYQHSYHRGKSDTEMRVKNHIGTDAAAPYQVTWNTELIPDQTAGSIRLHARIRDNNGVWFVTNEVGGLGLRRDTVAVKLYRAINVPERFNVRSGRTTMTSNFIIPSTDSLSRAISARLLLPTWNGLDQGSLTGETRWTKVNTWTAPAYGEGYFYSFDALTVPVSALMSGVNSVTFFGNSSGHGIEILWPGPAMLVTYASRPSIPPTVVLDPSDRTVLAGETASFTVAGEGDAPLAYRWQRNGADIAGAGASTYVTPPTGSADNGSVYRCIVANRAGLDTSAGATLTVIIPPPVVTKDPASQPVASGRSATFFVRTAGTPPLAYQWTRNGAPIGGATQPWYTTPSLALSDSGARFACTVTNGGGTVQSAEAVLSVSGSTPPSIITSDDFNAGALHPRWFFSDPAGDVTMQISGAGTQDARVVLGIPGASSHDLWTGENRAPRLLQPANNTDFEMEARFESNMALQYQFQGLLVEQDGGTFARFDFVRRSTGFRVFAATFLNGTATTRADVSIAGGTVLFMRVRRTGNTWRQSYSTDGISWTVASTFTYTMSVGAAGIFAGNAGSPPPAFQALADYFFNTAAPVVPEDGTQSPPFFTSQPGDLTVAVGDTARFAVVVTGSPPLTYRWERDGTPIPGAESSTYTITRAAFGDTTARFRCIAANGLGSTPSNEVRLFVLPHPSGMRSDDFNAYGLNPALWSFVNPAGDASCRFAGTNSPDARIMVRIPGGTEHDAWTGGNQSARTLQSCANTDFELETKIESDLLTPYQFQGILIQQDVFNYMRFDFTRRPGGLYLFAASVVGNQPTARIEVPVPSSNPLFLRVRRSGNQWTQSYSADGTTWLTGGTFTHTLTVTSAGLFAGNSGSPSPPLDALFDYFFLTAMPVVPEDGGVAVDTYPPVITSVTPMAGSVAMGILWETDEMTTGSVAYGLTTAYELGSLPDTGYSESHSLLIPGLQPGNLYHFRVQARDSAGNTSVSIDDTVRTVQPTLPVFWFWYGKNLTFGETGNPVPDVNILGNVQDGQGVLALSYTLNGGPSVPLGIGPDTRRLASRGDFNMDIPRSNLLPGPNQVIVTAVDSQFTVAAETVLVQYIPDRSWPSTCTVNWNSVSSVTQAAQVLDGLWTIQNGSARPLRPGYDRLLAMGDQAWDDYELTVPVTIHSIDSSGFRYPSEGAFVGLIFRWPGHSTSPPSTQGFQPKAGYLPLGALATYGWDMDLLPRFKMWGNNIATIAQQPAVLTFGTRYIFKMRVQTLPGLGPQYCLKVWQEGQQEPSQWNLVGQQSFTDPQTGCLLLVAHHVDASFGNLTVVPLSTPSTIVSDDFHADTLNTSLWAFTDPWGNASYEMQGGGTLEARLALQVPAGARHEPWAPSNTAVRVMQPANNTNFQVEARFESPLADQIQMHGILAEQDSANFVRFDFSTAGTETRVFAGTASGGVYTARYNQTVLPQDPPYMRVRRQGDLWTLLYSYDGTAWTEAVSFVQALTLNRIGPFAGNAGSSPPAYTALVDYFFNTDFPIDPEDGGGGGVAARIGTQPAGATVWAGDSASFSVTPLGTPPLQLRWQRNGLDIPGSTGTSYTTPPVSVAADSGAVFRCIVSNSLGADTSIGAVLNVRYRPSTIVSDDFHTGVLDPGLWRFVNLRGDASVSVTGAGTQNARLQFAVPGGVSHDVWTGGNFAPRILQKANNTNFQVEVKFESGITSVYQIQGILVQQTARDFLRFDFVTHPTLNILRAFSASFVNGTPTTRLNVNTVPRGTAPLWLRVKRSGDVWSLFYSTNGSSFTPAGSYSYSLVVDSVGVFAGNAGSPVPAFTSLVDYFFNTDSVMIPEDGVAPSITAQPSDRSVIDGQRAIFSVSTSGSVPMSYQWRKNGLDIPGASGPSYTTQPAALADSGSLFSARIWNAFGTVTSNPAVLHVTAGIPLPWWNTAWRYRIPVEIGAAGYERLERPAEAVLDFTAALAALGGGGVLDVNSIRVIETDSGRTVLDTLVDFQFDPDPDFNAGTRARGTLVLLLKGITSASSTRRYDVYFETTGGAFTAPAFTPRVAAAETSAYQGQESFRIATEGALYFYHKQGAGFAGLLDNNALDWISYRPGGGAGGEYRGIPNAGDVFHPGYTNSTSTLERSGPLRARIRSVSTNGLWEAFWDIFPSFARMTMLRKASAYWWLYEGTPGGVLDPATDYVVRATGQRTTAATAWSGDLPGEEWTYFGDASLQRVLFAVHHDTNSINDYYRQMDTLMTVFGFGRKDPCCTRYIDVVPQTFTIGFAEDSSFAGASRAIRSSYRDLAVTVRSPQIVGSAGVPILSTITSDNFNSPSLNTSLWSFYNPRGDASLTMTGNALRISIPAGQAHDVWYGGNMAPRVMQPANNTDFEVEARFQTIPLAAYQIQGFIVQEAPGEYLRADFVRTGSGLRVFAATFTADTPTTRINTPVTAAAPVWMRLKRVGSAWTFTYSTNGSTWTTAGSFDHPMIVASVGPFFGNAGGVAPAFTGEIDYFFNTEVPLVPTKPSRGPVAGEEAPGVPASYFLQTNYPNPFNPRTAIPFGLPEPAHVELRIFNMLGQEVRLLADGPMPAGYHQTHWDGRNGRGQEASSGVYLCAMTARGESGRVFTGIRRMILLR
ncbi:MAG: immunoglobulin domain-containing protein [Bacteroidota bacterium]